MKRQTRISAPLAAVLLAAVFLTSVCVATPATLATTAHNGRYVSLTKTSATPVSTGIRVTGELQRNRFSPRRPLPGTVSVSVLTADGALLQRTTLRAGASFVPTGIRTITFDRVVEGVFPADCIVRVAAQD